jgi:hypothetical protein
MHHADDVVENTPPSSLRGSQRHKHRAPNGAESHWLIEY